MPLNEIEATIFQGYRVMMAVTAAEMHKQQASVTHFACFMVASTEALSEASAGPTELVGLSEDDLVFSLTARTIAIATEMGVFEAPSK